MEDKFLNSDVDETQSLLQNECCVKEVQQNVMSSIKNIQNFKLGKCKSVRMQFNDVIVWTGEKIRSSSLIIKGISGVFKEGTSTAILGPSGSGKTTLLNFLAGRKSSSTLQSSGSLEINGRKVDSVKDLKHLFGYVGQDDILYEEFTPREQFMYSAKLSAVPNPEAKVKEVIKLLGLEKCQHTRVGSPQSRGISGGEKKRTSIGVDLVADPSFIFLDEPTTGLDSKSALDIANILNLLARKGRTVVATIHQPSKEVLKRFDKVIFLCEGQIVYEGLPYSKPGKEENYHLKTYLEEAGFEVPHNYNPADFLLTLINTDPRREKSCLKELSSTSTSSSNSSFYHERKEKLVKHHLANRPNKLFTLRSSEYQWTSLKTDNRKISSIKNFFLVLKRFLTVSTRNKGLFHTKVAQSTSVGLLVIVLYYNMASPRENTYRAIQDRTGLIFSTVLMVAFSGSVTSIFGIISQLKTFQRELEKRLYSPISFYLASTLFHFPAQLFFSMLFQCIFWWFIDTPNGINSFFMFYLLLMVQYWAASGFGDILAVVFQNLEKISLAVPLAVMPMFMLSGVSVVVKDTAFYLYYYSFLSFFRFGFQAGAYLQFDESERKKYLRECTYLTPICPEGKSPCIVRMPGEKLCDPYETLDFSEHGFWLNLIILAWLGLLYRYLAFMIFFMKTRKGKIKRIDNISLEEVKGVIRLSREEKERGSYKFLLNKRAYQIESEAIIHEVSETREVEEELNNTITDKQDQSILGEQHQNRRITSQKGWKERSDLAMG